MDYTFLANQYPGLQKLLAHDTYVHLNAYQWPMHEWMNNFK